MAGGLYDTGGWRAMSYAHLTCQVHLGLNGSVDFLLKMANKMMVLRHGYALTSPGLNTNKCVFAIAFGLKVYMWGHRPACNCPLCLTFPRVFDLVCKGSELPGFIHLAGEKFRVFECQLRDITSQLDDKSAPSTPKAGQPSGAGPPPIGPPPLPAPAAEPKAPSVGREKEGEADPPRVSTKENLGIFLKAKPGYKFGKAEAQEVGVKEEPQSDGVEPIAEPEEVGREGRRDKKESKRKDKKRSRSEERSFSAARGSKDRKKETKRKPSTSEEKKRERGKEKKRREERETDRSLPRKVPEPKDPPKGGKGQKGKDQGKGWTGPVPYSDHPRWRSSTNKGIVKRAKQERYYNRDRYGRR